MPEQPVPLRYDVVVKTTGCEAMFIHAMRDLPSQEIFIYRPYDKATIWEQRNLLQLGAALRILALQAHPFDQQPQGHHTERAPHETALPAHLNKSLPA